MDGVVNQDTLAIQEFLDGLVHQVGQVSQVGLVYQDIVDSLARVVIVVTQEPLDIQDILVQVYLVTVDIVELMACQVQVDTLVIVALASQVIVDFQGQVSQVIQDFLAHQDGLVFLVGVVYLDGQVFQAILAIVEGLVIQDTLDYQVTVGTQD